ncbi:MAG: metallophosphoesterase [Clostridia bacterium]|nr:metallophosphoesterase [Clostridia bacterium]
MKPFKRILALALSLLLGMLALSPAFAAADPVDVSRPANAHLSFNADGKLKILQVADIQDDESLDSLAKKSLKRAVEVCQPDLIMLTGDNIAGYSCKTKAAGSKAIKNYMDLFEGYGIPVAMVFGNHDDDDTPYTKLEQIEQYETYDCFIGCAGVVAEKTVGENHTINAGTYNIPVFESKDSDKVLFNIWCFDSGNYNPDDTYGGYGYVLPEQVDWYKAKSDELKAANGGAVVPSIAFQHIVPPQVKDALKEVPEGTEGAVAFAGSYYTLPDDVDPATNWLAEAPCPPNPAFEPGYAQVDAMLEKGDVTAIFFGHDHINSYIVDYEGIDLVSSPGCTFSSYNDGNRGFRVITIDKNNPAAYETYTVTTEELLNSNAMDAAALKIRAFFEKIGDFFENLWDQITAIFKK